MSVTTSSGDDRPPRRTRKLAAPAIAKGNDAAPARLRGQYSPGSNIPHVESHPFGFNDQGMMRSTGDISPEEVKFRAASNFNEMAMQAAAVMRKDPRTAAFEGTMLGLMNPNREQDYSTALAQAAARVEPANAIAKAFRSNTRQYQTVAHGKGEAMELPTVTKAQRDAIRERDREIAKGGAIAKSVLDVGTQTTFTSITGGQTLGYVSLDTRMARGTVRPDSFTLYQALNKSAAYQVVDYWAYVDDTGGALPGGAYQGFSNVNSGTLTANAGIYSLQSVNLKLALDGRAVTTALMAQNSFVDVVAQENANAALSVLSSVNWASYWGNTTYYANQQAGLATTIPTTNIFDYLTFYNNNAVINSWSAEQALYNQIYEVAAVLTSWGKFGRITHAFMTPTTNGALQGLVTTTLNNIVTNITREQREIPGIVVDGDLQGMRTRMGVIQFPLDLFITARNTPAQGQVRANGTTPATTSGPTPPTGVTAALVTNSSSKWGISVFGTANAFAIGATGAVTVTGTANYVWAVASTDANSNESLLCFTAPFSGMNSGVAGASGVRLTIAPPGAADATAFRVFRSANGVNATGTAGIATGYTSGYAPYMRYVGTVAANGSSNVTFDDLNATIPGGETIFLLDMREEDFALDYRFLLPLTRIELFAQNLFMPWAVASIGAIRNRIPKFHGIIQNFLPDNPTFNPLQPNF